jgi:hypothetical protein
VYFRGALFRAALELCISSGRAAHSLDDVSELGVPPSESGEGVWITSMRMTAAALY